MLVVVVVIVVVAVVVPVPPIGKASGYRVTAQKSPHTHSPHGTAEVSINKFYGRQMVAWLCGKQGHFSQQLFQPSVSLKICSMSHASLLIWMPPTDIIVVVVTHLFSLPFTSVNIPLKCLHTLALRPYREYCCLLHLHLS